MNEVFIPLSMYCSLGQTKATVLVSTNADLRDNVTSFTTAPCPGYIRWTEETIRKVEEECETQSSDGSGIIPGRQNVLNQRFVDRSRLLGGEHVLTIFNCSPITSKQI